MVLRRMGLKNIHREHFNDYEDVFMVPRTPRGDFVEKQLATAIRKLRESGKLAELYAKVHQPYSAWQP